MTSEIWLLLLIVLKADGDDWRMFCAGCPQADEKLSGTWEIQAHSQTIPVITHSFDPYRRSSSDKIHQYHVGLKCRFPGPRH